MDTRTLILILGIVGIIVGLFGWYFDKEGPFMCGCAILVMTILIGLNTMSAG